MVFRPSAEANPSLGGKCARTRKGVDRIAARLSNGPARCALRAIIFDNDNSRSACAARTRGNEAASAAATACVGGSSNAIISKGAPRAAAARGPSRSCSRSACTTATTTGIGYGRTRDGAG
jgi:hypothetical protein